MQFSQDAYLTVRTNIRSTRTFSNVMFFFYFVTGAAACCYCLQFSDHKNFCVSHDIPLARTKFDPAKITRCSKRNRPKKKDAYQMIAARQQRTKKNERIFFLR